MQGIKRPTLLVNKGKAQANISRMLSKARGHGAVLRPHFKTHQSLELGQWFREAGVDQIAVSSVSMARQFVADGWKDILIAFPVNLREMDEINILAATTRLGLTVSAPGVMALLAKALKAPVELWMKVDLGTHRTGFDPKNPDAIRLALQQAEANSLITMAGVLAHAGHTYHAGTPADILKIHQDSMGLLNGLKASLADAFPGGCKISWGDTPSCSLSENFYGADELRPGNFVYYDLMQHNLGACGPEDIAVAVAAPVVALHPERKEMVIYCGAVHLSKEQGKDAIGNIHYGQVVMLNKSGHWIFPDEACYVNRLSQEHGVIRLPEALCRKFSPGELAGILPVHSCLTADLLRADTRFI